MKIFYHITMHNLYNRNTAHEQAFIINFLQSKIPDHFISYPQVFLNLLKERYDPKVFDHGPV